ncbi:MAG: hypothetical protein JWO36_4383 [Myxococcales bacterium]|nr:hypothetical protein [Myxococcales bacterium]
MTFTSLTAETAADAAKPILVASERRFGFLPSPIARAAHSPVMLQHLLAGFAAFDKTSLAHAEREIVAMTVAFEVGCHYCMAMHSALGTGDPSVAPLVSALRDGTSLNDPRLEALRIFAREIVRTRGHASPEIRAAFAAAGYDEQAALDVVLGVGVYLLSTFANILTDAPLDPPFAAFAWEQRSPVHASGSAGPMR